MGLRASFQRNWTRPIAQAGRKVGSKSKIRNPRLPPGLLMVRSEYSPLSVVRRNGSAAQTKHTNKNRKTMADLSGHPRRLSYGNILSIQLRRPKMQMWIRRWWVKTWAPFSLVVLGAVILWVLDFNSDSGFVALMAVLIVFVGGSLTNLRSPPPRSFNKRWH